MLCYRDMTFCSFFETCVDGPKCGRALTKTIIDGSVATGLAISQFMEKPECHKHYKEGDMLRDFLGNPIDIGDTIVYPVRQGSNMWMNKGTVLFVTKLPHYSYGKNYELALRKDNGKVVKFWSNNRAVVVEKRLAPEPTVDKVEIIGSWRRMWLKVKRLVTGRDELYITSG